MWQIPLELKRQLSTIPLICDPSHICGSRDYIFEVSQNAMDLDYDGLIIETHRDPLNAWSDASQQITPETLSAMIKNLKFRTPTSKDRDFISILGELREQIDHVDKELFEIIAQRMDIVEKMGLYKKKNNVTVFQKNRWQEISETRNKWAEELNKNGFEVDVVYAFDSEKFARLTSSDSLVNFHFQNVFIRFIHVLKSISYDRVIVRRSVLLYNDYGNLFLDKLLLSLHPNAILDFDDDLSNNLMSDTKKTLFGKLLMEDR